MRHILIFGIILLITLSSCTQPPEDVPKAAITPAAQREPASETAGTMPIDIEASTFEFEGYGPGRSHKGTFTQMEGTLTVENGNIVAAQGTIQPESVDTGIEGLNRHLKTPDFFDVDRCPDITFSGTIEGNTMTGTLDFHCITHEVSFPVTTTENTLGADFLLDITPFEMRYVGINDNVRITFTAQI